MLKNMFSKRFAVRWLVVAGALLLVASGALWWYRLSVEPERVFWNTVEQSLSTSGVALSSTLLQEQASLEQHMQYSLGAENKAFSRTTLKQGGAEVITEVLGVPGAEYTRYVHVTTERTNAEGGPLDLSKIINVWAKSDRPAGTSPLLSQTALGLTSPLGSMPMPIGNLNPDQRNELIKQIRTNGVYEIDHNKVKKERKDGRLYLTYEVKIQAIPYVGMIKEFAQQIGMHDLDQIDPNDYAAEPLTVEIKIDARAKRIAEVYVPVTDFRQTFSSYDVPVAADVPADSVPAEELQKRLNEL